MNQFLQDGNEQKISKEVREQYWPLFQEASFSRNDFDRMPDEEFENVLGVLQRSSNDFMLNEELIQDQALSFVEVSDAQRIQALNKKAKSKPINLELQINQGKDQGTDR